MIANWDLATRFSDKTESEGASMIKRIAYAFALQINDLCPDGREKKIAVEKLEEAVFWANAAIERGTVEK